jgi:hypothetical protein
MKKWLIGGLLGVLVLLLLGYGFWSLGSMPETRSAAAMVLRVEAPTVEVRFGDAQEWKQVDGEVAVSVNDEIRTGPQGRATIVFFGGGAARLQEGTTVTVEEAEHGMDRVETSVVRLRMTSGRVWSRIMTLFDLGSSFSVRTDNVVATVRGTAFDLGMSTSGTTVWVSDSAVQMADAPGTGPRGSDESFFMGEGNMATRRRDGKWSAVESMKTEDRSTPWFTKNLAEDQAFEADTRSDLSAEFSALGNPRVGSFLERLVKASERLHIRFAGEKAPAVYGDYVGRRLFAIKNLIDQGKSGLAFQAFTPMEADIVAMLKTEDAERFRPTVRRTIRRLIVLLGDVSPSSPQYRFLQRLEDLNELVSGDDQALRLYSRLMGIDARLGTAARLIDGKALEEARMSLDAAHQGILNVTKDLDLAKAGMRTAEAEALIAKRDAMVAREEALRARLAAALAPPVIDTGAATSTSMTPTSTTPGTTTPKPPATTTSTAPVTTPPTSGTSVYTHILLSAQPNPVTVGSASQLRVTGVKSDGTTADVTSKATFKLIGNLGTLNGPTYTATQAGSVTVEANLVDGSSTKKATVTIQVNAPVALSRIDIASANGTSLRTGMTSALTVTATYSSGLTANVTTKATWQTSDASVGSMNGSTFATTQNGGTATVTATYTENGVTKTNAMTFTVTGGAATYTPPLQ